MTAGRDFNEAGKLSVKNGDVVIVTRSGYVLVSLTLSFLSA